MCHMVGITTNAGPCEKHKPLQIKLYNFMLVPRLSLCFVRIDNIIRVHEYLFIYDPYCINHWVEAILALGQWSAQQALMRNKIVRQLMDCIQNSLIFWSHHLQRQIQQLYFEDLNKSDY